MVTLAFLWEKLSQPQCYKGLTRKTAFLRGGLGSRLITLNVWPLRMTLRYDLEILQECGKRPKTKSQDVLGANSYVCRSYREKTGRGVFCSTPPPILNRVTSNKSSGIPCFSIFDEINCQLNLFSVFPINSQPCLISAF